MINDLKLELMDFSGKVVDSLTLYDGNKPSLSIDREKVEMTIRTVTDELYRITLTKRLMNEIIDMMGDLAQ